MFCFVFLSNAVAVTFILLTARALGQEHVFFMTLEYFSSATHICLKRGSTEQVNSEGYLTAI